MGDISVVVPTFTDEKPSTNNTVVDFIGNNAHDNTNKNSSNDNNNGSPLDIFLRRRRYDVAILLVSVFIIVMITNIIECCVYFPAIHQ